MEKKTIGSFIAALRKTSGMTQQEMADRLHISNKAVSRWERDECSPDLSLIPAIAEMFGVTCDELLKGERITGNAETSKPSPKIEKQVKQILNRNISNFKSAAYIAIACNFLGFVLLFAISYGFYKPIIGFAVLLAFAIAGAILILLSQNKLNDRVKDNELFDNLAETDVDYFKKIKYKFTFTSLFINIMTILWGLPFVVVRDPVFLDSVISFEYYIKLMPLFILITLVIFIVAGKISRHFFFGGKYRITFEKSIILLDIFQLLCPFLLVASVNLLHFMRVDIDGIVGIVAVLFYVLLILFIFIPLFYFPVKYKENRKGIAAAGMRNAGLIIVFIVFSRGISSYEIFDGVNNSVKSGISYEPYYAIPAIILLAIVLGGYALLKKYWVK